MKYRTIYSEKVKLDIKEIALYLSQFYASTARNFMRKLKEQVQTLKTMPNMYPVYEEDAFFRRMVCGDYIIFYSVDENNKRVVIHRVFHHSRDIQPHMLG